MALGLRLNSFLLIEGSICCTMCELIRIETSEVFAAGIGGFNYNPVSYLDSCPTVITVYQINTVRIIENSVVARLPWIKKI